MDKLNSPLYVLKYKPFKISLMVTTLLFVTDILFFYKEIFIEPLTEMIVINIVTAFAALYVLALLAKINKLSINKYNSITFVISIGIIGANVIANLINVNILLCIVVVYIYIKYILSIQCKSDKILFKWFEIVIAVFLALLSYVDYISHILLYGNNFREYDMAAYCVRPIIMVGLTIYVGITLMLAIKNRDNLLSVEE